MSDDPTRGRLHQIRGGRDDPPSPDGPARRLAAILAADISGYSRLMGMDEEGTLARIKRQRRELIEPTIAEHHGRLVKYTGDGFLAMFDSPVEAVRAAIVIQQSMVGRNASLPKQQWILYRFGVHLGDVIVEDDDIYGDGVNIAARLESIAEPGHLFISGGVYEQIKNKLVCGYQSLGDRHVKNITDPLNVYRVLPDPAALLRARRARWPLGALAAVGVIAIVGGAGLYWLMQHAIVPTLTPPTEPRNAPPSPAQSATTVAPPAPAPARPPNEALNAPPPAQAPAPTPAPAPPPTETLNVPPPTPARPPAETLNVPPPASAPARPQTETLGVAPPRPPAPAPAPIISQVIPDMISLPGGAFAMGSNDDPSEKPIRRVTVKPFAMSKFPITVREWKACVSAGACSYSPTGNDDAPVTNVNWNDAQQFVGWLSRTTQKQFRLPSEAEWEYAARGGKATKFWWGDQFQVGMANCKGCNEPYDATQPLKVGSFKPNPFGLHDMGGGVHQWVADCWHKNYQGAPLDSSPWIDSGCSSRVIRSGSWRNDTSYVRPANRDHYDTDVRYPTHGFRVALSL
jgi:formylglycine-generating enzyme required for sulfatase activity/class 3 adenylate cyclase